MGCDKCWEDSEFDKWLHRDDGNMEPLHEFHKHGEPYDDAPEGGPPFVPPPIEHNEF